VISRDEVVIRSLPLAVIRAARCDQVVYGGIPTVYNLITT
jgi:hypothetical protein